MGAAQGGAGAPHSPPPPNALGYGATGKALRAFTMVEIAIALGIIAFALVAVIGILPAGLQVQKETRERSIMDKEAEYWIHAIKRSGDYTNDFHRSGVFQDDAVDFVESVNGYTGPFDNTARLIGGLIRTNYIVTYDAGGVPSVEWTEPVVAIMRPFNGSAIERSSNLDSRDFAFKYQMNVHIAPSFTIRPDHPDYNALQSKLWELKLEFAWPILPNGQALRTQAVHRATIAGDLTTADHPLPSDFYYFAR